MVYILMFEMEEIVMRPLAKTICDGDYCEGTDLSIAKAFTFKELEGQRFCSHCAEQIERHYRFKYEEDEQYDDDFEDDDE